MKSCLTCKQHKSKNEFYTLHSSKDGLTFDCIECAKRKSILRGHIKRQRRIDNRVVFEGEVYRKAPNADSYEVSNFGNVFSFFKQKQIKPTKSKKGYLTTKLSMNDGSKAGFPVHRLVAMLFIENPLKLPQVNHLDGNKINNKSSNLEWSTCKKNIEHAIRTGLRSATINLRKNDYFSKEDVLVIKGMISDGFGNQEISQLYCCDHSTISKIRTGHHYGNNTIQ